MTTKRELCVARGDDGGPRVGIRMTLRSFFRSTHPSNIFAFDSYSPPSHTNPPLGIPPHIILDFEYFPSPNAGHHHASLMRGPWILSAHPVTHEGVKEPEGVSYVG